MALFACILWIVTIYMFSVEGIRLSTSIETTRNAPPRLVLHAATSNEVQQDGPCHVSDMDHIPCSYNKRIKSTSIGLFRKALAVTFGAKMSIDKNLFQSAVEPAYAIGNIFELSEQNMCFQGITLNVADTKKEALLLSDTLQQTVVVISDTFVKGESTTVLAFGPTAYESPKSFRPGVSWFSEDGAHCTLTLKDRVILDKTLESGDQVVEVFEPGNGLQYIKFGTEVLRLSKAIAAGSEIKYAYGWVDIVSPSGIPYEFTVGVARDPLMTVGIAVSNMQQSVKFFTESLGMKVLPFNLARTPGSNFEAQPKKGDTYVGYSNNTLGFWLTQAKGGKVDVGSVLDSFNIVVDDTVDREMIPKDVINTLENKSILYSPDGYPFRFTTYTDFKKSAEAVKEFSQKTIESVQQQKQQDKDDQENESQPTPPKIQRKKTKFGRDGQANMFKG